MTRRAVVWAAVSSRPQAERDSIDQQLVDGGALAAAQGWQVVATLVVPGESRDYIDLADALAGLDERLRPGEENAYRRLLDLLAGRAFDVLVCRARDRLGRTDALIAGVEERCRRAGVVVWSIAMPPSGSEAGDLYVSAVERAGAQREMVELQRRHRYGMDGRLRRGEMLSNVVPFGYRAEIVVVGRGVERRAVVEPAEAGAYRELVAETLARGATEAALMERMRGQFPDRKWPASSVSYILRNPFHVGLVLRRRRQEDAGPLLRVFRPSEPSIFDHPDWPAAEALLTARASRSRWANRDASGRQKVHLLALGTHEPVIELPQWLALQREMESRSDAHRPHAPGSLWGGMAVCGLCGAPMHFHTSGPSRSQRYFYYRCARRDRRYGNCQNDAIRLEALTAAAVGYLAEFYHALEAQVDGTPQQESATVDLLASIVAQRVDLLAQRERLEMMAISGRISLETFDERTAALDGALLDVEGRLSREQAALASRERAVVRLALVRTMLPDLESRLLAADPVEVNRWLKEAIEAVVVTRGEVVVIMR